MIIINYGVEKSGSTLAWEMTKVILELNGHPQVRLAEGLVNPTMLKGNIGGPWTDESLSNFVDATRGMRIAVKTHHPPEAATGRILEYVESGDLRIHVTYRDPRDTVVSMLDYDLDRARVVGRPLEFHTLEDAIQRLGQRLTNFRDWGSLPSLKLRYDEFAFDPHRGPQMIAEDLGLPVDPARVWEIVGGRPTKRNVAQPMRYASDLWPEEIARIERAFPLFLDVVRGNPPAGWFVRPD